MNHIISNFEGFEMLSKYYDEYKNFDILQLICDKNLIIMLNKEYTLEKLKNLHRSHVM